MRGVLKQAKVTGQAPHALKFNPYLCHPGAEFKVRRLPPFPLPFPLLRLADSNKNKNDDTNQYNK